MNAAQCKTLRERETEMYQLGYGYGAWVVHKDLLGLSPVCSLTYFREPPTAEDLAAAYGDDVLHVATAEPVCRASEGDDPLDHEVLADAAD